VNVERSAMAHSEAAATITVYQLFDRDAGHGGHAELRRAADDSYNCTVALELIGQAEQP
jgi:hypothetical protein